jgi:hypothetical protein
MSPKLSGQSERQPNVFDRIRDFLISYVVFPDPVLADVCALWAMGTHCYQRFDSFGYLVITASVKRAGKTVLAECLSMVSHDAFMGTGISPSVIRDYIAQGKSVFFDESELLNSEGASQMRAYLNIGYRYGQTIPVRVGVDEIRKMPAYGPKCFVLIGDVNDTLRDRSIVIELRPSTDPPNIYRYRTAKMTADLIQGKTDDDNGDSDLTRAIDATYRGEIIDAFDVPILRNREGEIWSVIFSLANAFCPERLDAIKACAVNLATTKMTTEKRRFSEIRDTEEGKRTDDTFTKWALQDLASVFKHGERKLYSADAIERMKAIPTSPWRAFRGPDGLTQQMLSDLLSSLGVNTKDVKTYERDKHGKIIKPYRQVVKRGFQLDDVKAGLARMGGK